MPFCIYVIYVLLSAILFVGVLLYDRATSITSLHLILFVMHFSFESVNVFFEVYMNTSFFFWLVYILFKWNVESCRAKWMDRLVIRSWAKDFLAMTRVSEVCNQNEIKIQSSCCSLSLFRFAIFVLVCSLLISSLVLLSSLLGPGFHLQILLLFWGDFFIFSGLKRKLMIKIFDD